MGALFGPHAAIQDNEIHGDVAARDLYKSINLPRAPTPMSRLVQKYLSETEADQRLSAWTEKLEHYLSNEANPDIRSLEEKLIASNREELIQSAVLRKQRAYKSIMRHQGSRSAQQIFAYILAELVVNYEQYVWPLIQSGAERTEVDGAMEERVISPALNSLEDNPLDFDKLDIQSLLYYLAGNCYVRWDPC